MPDLQQTLTRSARERTDELGATAEAAEALPLRRIIAGAQDGSDLVRRLTLAGAAASASRMGVQLDSVVAHVRAEGKALAQKDATKAIRPISDDDIAADRSAP